MKFTPTRGAEQAAELGVENWLAATGQRSVASAWLLDTFNKNKRKMVTCCTAVQVGSWELLFANVICGS